MQSLAKTINIVEALMLLAATDFMLSFAGGARTIGLAGKLATRKIAISSQNDSSSILRIRDSYNVARLIYPRRVECLHRSLTVFIMLRRRGIPAAFHLSVRKYPFASHAWIERDGPFFQDEQSLVSTLTNILTIS
jgi:hypothetical protein